MSVIWYVVAAVLILIGLAGTILPMVPGVPLVFAGMLLAAWVGGFTTIGVWTVVFLGVLALFAVALDLLAGLLGAKRVRASTAALWGALIGTFVGMFLGLAGLILGPFVGAVAGELGSSGNSLRAAHVGVATWLGLIFGTLAKIALSLAMLGVFVLALIIP